MQPGQTINPGDSSDNKPQEPVQAPPVETTPAPEPIQTVQTPPTDTTAQNPAAEPQQNWQYNASDTPSANQTVPSDIGSVHWTASEFIDHDKRAGWFIGLAAAAAVACVLVYFVTHDTIATVMIVVAAALFGVTAGRKPNTLDYNLDSSGIKIGSKLYEYNFFKSFSVIEEGALSSIQLTPLARFSPPISLYYPPEQEDQILNTLSNYLPHEERHRDPVDRLMRRIRF
jgi:hypothetical protein